MAERPYHAWLAQYRPPVGLDLGAAYPARGTGLALVMIRLDIAEMNLLLAELGPAIALSTGIVLDKAGWHTAADVAVPSPTLIRRRD